MTQQAKPSDARTRWVQFAAEWLLLIVVAVVATQRYASLDARLLLGGYESEWNTSFAVHAVEGLREQGRIPLWQPLMERGEPSLEGLVSSTLNPFSLFPSVIFGAEVGVRYSIITHVVIAGLGGWAIGWVLGFALPARLLLGALLLAKGNMPAIAGMGFYQLATTQAYLPWVVAATIAIARFRQHRTPVVLLAVALTLLYLGGTIYYMLPALIVVGALGGAYAVKRAGRSVRVDTRLMGRYAVALALTVALSAVTFLPLVLQQAYFGGHPDEALDAVYETPLTALAQMFTPARYFVMHTWSENYVLYVVPIWFVVLLFIALPPFVRRWNRTAIPGLSGRLLIVALVLGVFFLLWGTGTNPIIEWAYANLPLIAQWRVVSRLLTIVTLLLAIVIALRFDGLWRALIIHAPARVRRYQKGIAGGILILLAGLAAGAPLSNFDEGYPIRTVYGLVEETVAFIRQQHPERQITLIGRDYHSFKPYLDHHVRFTFINADLEYLPVAPTLFPYPLRFSYAEYAMITAVIHEAGTDYGLVPDESQREFWMARGYVPVADSPYSTAETGYLLRYDEALPYAFAAPRAFLESYTPPQELFPSHQTRHLAASQVIPLPNYVHLTDHVVLAVQPLADEPLVVTLQELAYPGWAVTVDGQPAPLESVGGLIGVTLPEGTVPRQIIFRYDPPLFKIGALITITTVVLASLWLVRADVRWRAWRRR